MTGIKKAIVGMPILVKRYARSRLYDTAGRRYVTIEDLRTWRLKRVAFIVEDAETGAT